MISAILANARALSAKTGTPPILLLDEVAAHLDAARRAALYDAVCAMGAQCFMTGTGPDLFAELAGRAQHFALSDRDGVSHVEKRIPHEFAPANAISLVTLGVDDLTRARAFYAALGWTEAEATDGMACFQLLGQALMLFGRADLAKDQGRAGADLGTGGFDAGAEFRHARGRGHGLCPSIGRWCNPAQTPRSCVLGRLFGLLC